LRAKRGAEGILGMSTVLLLFLPLVAQGYHRSSCTFLRCGSARIYMITSLAVVPNELQYTV